MGICESSQSSNTSNKSKGYSTNNQNSGNPQSQMHGESQPVQQNQKFTKVNSIKYPQGKSFLLKQAVNQTTNFKSNNNDPMDDLKSPIELFLTIINKINVNLGFKVQILINSDGTDNFKVLAETDFSEVTQEYAYPMSIALDYYFEKQQRIIVNIMSSDNSIQNTYQSQIAYIMGSKKNIGVYEQDEFQLLIRGMSIQNNKTDLSMSLKVPVFNSGNQIYYIISNFNDTKNWRKVYKSEEQSEGGEWERLDVDSGAVCLGDIKQ